MKSKRFLFLGILLAGVAGILITACAKKADVEAELEKIMKTDKEWSSLASEGRDIDRIVSFWADDAIVYPPGAPPVNGKNAIRQYVTQSFKIPGFSIGWESSEIIVAKSRDFAYAVGKNHVTFNNSEGNRTTINGRGVTVWRKEADGSWKCIIDIWNEEPSHQPQTESR